ncbi:type III secretion system chaperone [Desulfocurvus sp. DL9XJH121]
MSITHDHLQALAKALGLPELALDDEQSCTLSFGGGLFVYLAAPAGSPFLALHSVAAILAGDPPDELFENILAWNAAPGNLPVTLGWDEEQGLVCACLRYESAALDVPGFVNMFEGFLARVRQVRDDVHGVLDNPGATARSAQGDPAPDTPMHRV